MGVLQGRNTFSYMLPAGPRTPHRYRIHLSRLFYIYGYMYLLYKDIHIPSQFKMSIYKAIKLYAHTVTTRTQLRVFGGGKPSNHEHFFRVSVCTCPLSLRQIDTYTTLPVTPTNCSNSYMLRALIGCKVWWYNTNSIRRAADLLWRFHQMNTTYCLLKRYI